MLMFFDLFSQDSYIKDRLSFQVGTSHVKRDVIYFNGSGPDLYTSYYTVSGYYGISRWAEVGAFFGYNSFIPSAKTLDFNSDGSVFSYGIASKHHLLPWIIKKESFRFDVYVPLNVGASYSTPYHYIPENTEACISSGLGIAGYITKHIGLFVEYDYTYWFNKRKRDFDKNTKHRLYYGIALKF
jgi:hypothetical protein